MIGLDPGDERYPRGLLDLAKPPDPLWVDGDISALNARAIAIVGTRRMTGYGERVARELAQACAAHGIVVVSGLAQGIDSAAHRGAVDGGGRTVAVLGESIATFCATVRGRRRPLVPRIRGSGALVSEFGAPLTPKPWTYVRRDATIAALASAVVVVEAPSGSGALITAADARRLGRALYAVPGPLGSSASVGTNALIASGRARALVDVRSLTGGAVRGPERDDKLLAALRDGAIGVDELARRVGAPPMELTTRLAPLLVTRRVAILPDGRVRLGDGR